MSTKVHTQRLVYTAREVQAMTGLSLNYIYKCSREQIIPCKILQIRGGGSRFLYPVGPFDRWIKDNGIASIHPDNVIELERHAI